MPSLLHDNDIHELTTNGENLDNLVDEIELIKEKKKDYYDT